MRTKVLFVNGKKNMSSQIAERIKEERKRLGYKKQDDIADACGISRESWGKYERGLTMPSGEVLLALAGLDMDIQYVLTGKSYKRELSPQERMILSAWHQASLTAQKEAMAVLSGIGQQQPAFQQRFGKVGNIVQNDGMTLGDISIDMSGGKGKKKE